MCKISYSLSSIFLPIMLRSKEPSPILVIKLYCRNASYIYASSVCFPLNLDLANFPYGANTLHGGRTSFQNIRKIASTARHSSSSSTSMLSSNCHSRLSQLTVYCAVQFCANRSRQRCESSVRVNILIPYPPTVLWYFVCRSLLPNHPLTETSDSRYYTRLRLL